jgi:hypothetical protein
MSLHNAAQHLAAHGRGPDTELVHMSKGEVASLQGIAKAHGGSLTVNPHTGLVEAGFLSSMLPMIAGGLLAATGVGAPLAALMVGGGVGLAKGDLKAGLMAGLGAYGGAGLMGGAAEMGAQAAGEKAGAEALGTTPEAMATQSGSEAALTTNPANNPAGYDAFGNTPNQTVAGGYDQATSGSYIDPAKGQAYSDAYSKAAQPSLANTGQGIQAAAQNPSAYLDKVGGGMKAAQYGLAAAAPAMQVQAPTPPTPEKYNGPLSKYSMSKDYKPYDVEQPNPYYQAQYQNYRGYAAGGGVIEQMSNANSVGQNTGYPQADIQQGSYATPWQTPISRNVVADGSDTGVDSFTGEPRGYAAGGQLGSYSDGGHMLKGPGDGMSDSIPAKIGRGQPARLADGEFVVPADVVSHLGNGSSDAGAKQLYAMMDRIRKARTGKKKQAPAVNPGKAMPA